MSEAGSKRNYSMILRAKSAETSRHRVLETVVKLLHEYSLNEISLELVSLHCGLTVRTILRKFDSRDGLMSEALSFASANLMRARELAPSGNIVKALEVLLSEYEATGDAVIRAMRIQEDVPLAKKVIQQGIAIHRQWCMRVFEPFLPPVESNNYETELLAFICATEIYLWKLLRRDLGKTYKQTFMVFFHTINSLVEKSNSNKLNVK